MYFDSFSFLPRIAANIRTLGYSVPTPIQEQAIPLALEGRDLMGLAQTGTGKTAAFLLPILQRLLTSPARQRGGVRALVVAPTRELAEQIHESARALGQGLRLRFATVYGGVGIAPQIRSVSAGADIVAACPGRLLDLVGRKAVDLSAVEVLVLDEADHMFDMGFFPDIRKILALLPEDRQTMLFSATMPESVRDLAGSVLNDPVTVRIGREAPAATVSHAAYPVAQHLKTPLLLALLGQAEAGPVLVFTRTKHRAKRLAEQLERAGHRAASIQGNLSQRQRQAALDGFRDGSFQVLVATDIAARGIDVTGVEHVVNYDIPDTPEAYTHRIGRTGRAGRAGKAHSLITAEDRSLLRAIEGLLGKELPRLTLDGFDYAAAGPARQEPSRPVAAPARSGGFRPDRSRVSQAGQRRSGSKRSAIFLGASAA